MGQKTKRTRYNYEISQMEQKTWPY